MVQPWHCETDPLILRRVGKTGEELSELSKVCFRIVIQGFDGFDPKDGKPNRQALTEELADVKAQIDLTIEKFGLSKEYIADRIAAKRKLMVEWERLVAPDRKEQ